jgi:hypothetical protein
MLSNYSQPVDESPAAASSASALSPTSSDPMPNTPTTLVDESRLSKEVELKSGASSQSESSAVRGSSIVLSPPAHDRKMVGYQGYSNFLSGDQTFFMVRRFRTLNVRAALALQDEIVELEADLNDREEYNKTYFQEYYDNGSIRLDPDKKRRELIKDKIVPRLTVYSKLFYSGQ